jgi:DNA polymerase III alpha subunit
MLDKFNRYNATEDTGIELLYQNKDLREYEFSETNDVTLYNQQCEMLDIDSINILNGTDFDRTSIFNIPQHYKDIDVEQYVKNLVLQQPAAEIHGLPVNPAARVEQELALYKARNLYPMLQLMIYIVNTMRKHNLVWGVGRGSSVSSYVLFLIGIHKIDSIKYNLDIREFLKED